MPRERLAPMNTYTARAERDEGGWWVVTVPELDGVFTQSRRLDRVEDLARDAISLWLEVPPTSFNVELKATVPKLDEQISRVDHLRREAERLREEATATSRELARELSVRGLTVRDIGQVLGISYQRAAQLLDEEKPLVLVAKDARSPGSKKPAKQSAKRAPTRQTRAR